MTIPDITALLEDTPFAMFLKVFPTGAQLPSFIAVARRLKPAMDMWVSRGAWEAFEKLVSSFELQYHIDTFFDRYSEEILKALPPNSFTTTRATLSRDFTDKAEAHVFIAKTQASLNAAVAAGWYPLVVDGIVVEKHLADHDKFGEALGYPACCREFFRQRNNWYYDNTYYAAYVNTSAPPQTLSNGLLRHTAFCLTPHLACSFACEASIAYGAILRDEINDEAPTYVAEIDRRLASPMLCLSELNIYRFAGTMPSTNRVNYELVEPIEPTNHSDSLYEMLARGDACIVDGNVVRVERRGSQIDAYAARADKHGPEFPFVIQCG
jgi:hypothetical protein